jgi:intein/homing endonuclease
MFTKGLGLTPETAIYKEIPLFLYNAPMECIKGFLAGFTEGDGSIGEYIRKRDSQVSPSRDIVYRLYSSSKKLIFGLNFLLKRIGVLAEFKIRKFDDIEHPTWHDAYILEINGRGHLNDLKSLIPNLPEYGNYARGKNSEIDLNPWMKKINNEMKTQYKISLRMLVERKKIPNMAAKCAQAKNKKNISEYRLLKTLRYLIQNDYETPTIKKLWKIFSIFTFTRIKKIQINDNLINASKLKIPYPGIYIAGIGQIYVY